MSIGTLTPKLSLAHCSDLGNATENREHISLRCILNHEEADDDKPNRCDRGDQAFDLVHISDQATNKKIHSDRIECISQFIDHRMSAVRCDVQDECCHVPGDNV